jgi:threonine/homoserine/homoserine lactone efflux protein
MPSVESLLLGFGVGLSGALAPGPTLLATISGAVRHGALVGARVAAGHLFLEGVLAVALILGIAPFVLSQRAGIAIIGGAALVGFGLLTMRGARTASLAPVTENERVGPFLAGVLTSVANPYFWIWWATLGGALLAAALASGPGDAALFLAGHGTADLAWLLLVGAAVARGSAFLPDRAYRLLLCACGIALVAIGAAYTATVL